MAFYATLPIKARDKVVGVLCVISDAPRTPDRKFLDILRAAIQLIGLAIENGRIYETAQKEADAGPGS